MNKRFFSLLAAFALCLTLIPTTAFADDEKRGEDVSPCSCETACTTDNMDKECPVCGAENAIPQNCGQYIPVEDRTGENGSTERADDPNGPTELSAADQVQAMIDGLPNAEEITEDNAEEVKAQLEAIDEAKEKLSDEEIDELDMTRYAEAAAALGALAAPMLLANDSPDEQFSLTPGGRYYFDLSAMNIPGTANGGNSDGAVSLPDTSLHYVPFTYAGTIASVDKGTHGFSRGKTTSGVVILVGGRQPACLVCLASRRLSSVKNSEGLAGWSGALSARQRTQTYWRMSRTITRQTAAQSGPQACVPLSTDARSLQTHVCDGNHRGVCTAEQISPQPVCGGLCRNAYD